MTRGEWTGSQFAVAVACTKPYCKLSPAVKEFITVLASGSGKPLYAALVLTRLECVRQPPNWQARRRSGDRSAFYIQDSPALLFESFAAVTAVPAAIHIGCFHAKRRMPIWRRPAVRDVKNSLRWSTSRRSEDGVIGSRSGFANLIGWRRRRYTRRRRRIRWRANRRVSC